MTTARVFKWENSQAVRLPKAFHVQGNEVEIFRRGDEIVMREKKHGMAHAYDLLMEVPLDVFQNRIDTLPQQRKGR